MNIDGMINYAKTFVGRVSYSMYGARDPQTGSADCSSFVYWSAVRGGGAKRWGYAYAPSTETMHQWLLDNGFKLIAENGNWNMQKGDIVIWGRKGTSWNAGGHTGICIDHQNWIECTAYRNLGVTIQNHDARLMQQEKTANYPYWYVYRYQGASNPPKKPVNTSHDQAVLNSPVLHQNHSYGKLEYYNMPSKGILEVRGWLVPDTPTGRIGSQACIILWDIDRNCELTRVMCPCTKRPDVKKAYGYKGGEHLGYSMKINVSWAHGRRVVPILRRCDDNKGNKMVNDVRFDIYFTLP